MKKYLLAAAACIALGSPAYAVKGCAPGKEDTRICTIAYSPNQVFQIWGTLRSVVIIVFGKTEIIAHVSAGDISSIHPEPMGPNILALKPTQVATEAREVQPIVVTTSLPDGSMRTYVMEFNLRPSGSIMAGTDGAQFEVQFTYPGDVAAAAAEAWRKKEREKIEQEIQTRMATIGRGSISGQNGYACDYVYQTDPKKVPIFLPTRVCDDGQKTFILVPGNTPVPAVSIDGPDGQPMVPQSRFDATGSYIEIEQVVRHIYLRSGDSLICVWKQNPPNPAGFNSGTHTSDRGVERVVKGDE